MGLKFQVPTQYCSYNIRPCLYHKLYPQLDIVFYLVTYPFILSGVISPLISCSILGTYQPGEFHFQYPIILPFHTVCGLLKARILKWFDIPFSTNSSDHLLSELSVMTHPSWVAPHGMAYFH